MNFYPSSFYSGQQTYLTQPSINYSRQLIGHFNGVPVIHTNVQISRQPTPFNQTNGYFYNANSLPTVVQIQYIPMSRGRTLEVTTMSDGSKRNREGYMCNGQFCPF